MVKSEERDGGAFITMSTLIPGEGQAEPYNQTWPAYGTSVEVFLALR